MATEKLHLITIWAKHEGHRCYPDTPQFVAAFPSSLADVMYELYAEWLKAACDNYRDAVDSQIIGFFEGRRASIDRPSWDTLSLVEDDAINPGWEGDK
jgi:hypothetical protein